MSSKVKTTAITSESKQENSVLKKKMPDLRQDQTSPFENIFFLQKAVGNQAVQRFLRSGAIRSKLKIRQPGDMYERESDRVADQAMRMPEPIIQPKPA